MHWAAHGHTAAEIIKSRSDASKKYMGLTSFTGSSPKRADAEIAKNYLTHDEIDVLNRLVSIYLEFAELQAKSRKPMYMEDWIKKLDDFLKVSEREVLTHFGKITHQEALNYAHAEFDKFKKMQLEEKTQVEKDFEIYFKELEKAGKMKPLPPGTNPNSDHQK